MKGGPFTEEPSKTSYHFWTAWDTGMKYCGINCIGNFPDFYPIFHTEVLYNTQNLLSQELLLVAASTATTSTLVAEFGGFRIYRLSLGK